MPKDIDPISGDQVNIHGDFTDYDISRMIEMLMER
jgi:hypothetical protein